MVTDQDIEQLVTDMIAELSEQTFAEAQKLAPSKSGTLKQSGQVTQTPTGFEITYTSPYAYALHEGKQGSSGGHYIMLVPTHTRQTRTGYTQVRAHTKTFQPGYKPTIRPDGTWYTSYTNPSAGTTQARPWIQEAWTRVWRRLDSRLKMFIPNRLKIEEGQ